MSFQEKYFKYKNKYLSLKKINQYGGDPTEEELLKSIRKIKDSINYKEASTPDNIEVKIAKTYEIILLFNKLIQINSQYQASLDLQEKILGTLIEARAEAQEKISAESTKHLIEEHKIRLKKLITQDKNIFYIQDFFYALSDSSQKEIFNGNQGNILILINNSQTDKFKFLKGLISLKLENFNSCAQVWDFLAHFYENQSITTINICLLDFLINDANGEGINLINSRIRWSPDKNMLGILREINPPSNISNLKETIHYLVSKGATTKLNFGDLTTTPYNRENYNKKYFSFNNLNQYGGGEKEELLAEVASLNTKIKTLVKLEDLKECYIKLFNTYERLISLFPEPQLIEQQKAFMKLYTSFIIKVFNETK